MILKSSELYLLLAIVLFIFIEAIIQESTVVLHIKVVLVILWTDIFIACYHAESNSE